MSLKKKPTEEEVCAVSDTQPVAKPRSGRRVRVVSNATRADRERAWIRTAIRPSAPSGTGDTERAPAVRVVLTKPAHRQLRRSESRPGKIPSTGEWEVIKSS